MQHCALFLCAIRWELFLELGYGTEPKLTGFIILTLSLRNL